MLGGATIINLDAADYYSASVDSTFANYNLDPAAISLDYGPVRTDDEFIVQDAFGTIIESPSRYGLSHHVVYSSMDPLALQSVMRVTAPVHDGDDLVMISQIAAQATHSFIDDFRTLATAPLARSRRRADTSISRIRRPCGSTRPRGSVLAATWLRCRALS